MKSIKLRKVKSATAPAVNRIDVTMEAAAACGDGELVVTSGRRVLTTTEKQIQSLRLKKDLAEMNHNIIQPQYYLFSLSLSLSLSVCLSVCLSLLRS